MLQKGILIRVRGYLVQSLVNQGHVRSFFRMVLAWTCTVLTATSYVVWQYFVSEFVPHGQRNLRSCSNLYAGLYDDGQIFRAGATHCRRLCRVTEARFFGTPLPPAQKCLGMTTGQTAQGERDAEYRTLFRLYRLNSGSMEEGALEWDRRRRASHACGKRPSTRRKIRRSPFRSTLHTLFHLCGLALPVLTLKLICH